MIICLSVEEEKKLKTFEIVFFTHILLSSLQKTLGYYTYIFLYLDDIFVFSSGDGVRGQADAAGAAG